MGISITDLFGGSVAKGVGDIISKFKLSPDKKADIQAAINENQAELAQAQLELDGKLQDAVSGEVQAAAEIIKAEAGSQSWLPRNVRPLLLFLWGSLITFNYFLPLVSQFSGMSIQPLVLDPWCYKLTAIGFTGYVTARSFEKIKGAA